MKDVLAIMGKPLTIQTQSWSETWHYSAGPVSTNSNSKENHFDLFQEQSVFYFNPDGVVTNQTGKYLTGNGHGLTRDQLLKSFGDPVLKEIKQPELIYHYSAPTKDKTYRQREVHFDQKGQVNQIVKRTWYD